MEKSIKACATLTLLVATLTISAQVIPKYGLGINIGSFIYQGDLSPWSSGSLKTPSLVIGFSGHNFINQVFSTRLDINMGSLKGDEAKYSQPAFRKQRAFAFKTSVTEVVVSGIYHPLGRSEKISPYIFGGIGYSFLQIKKDFSRFNSEYFANEPAIAIGLADDNKQKLPKQTFVIPVGVGLQYNFSQKWGLVTEASYRIMSNDYLDGFSKAANPSRGDHYYKYSIGLIYSLGAKSFFDCPVVKP